MKSILILILGLLSIFNSYSQHLASEFYFGIGYQISELKELNNGLNVYPEGSSINFNEQNGFNDISFGFHLNPIKDSKFYIDLSADYLFHKKQNQKFQTFKEVSGIAPDAPDQDLFYDLETVEYDYGFRFSSYTLGIVPSYSIISRDNLFLEIGVGICWYYSELEQFGVEISSTPDAWQSNATESIKYESAFGFDSKINFGFRLFGDFFLNTRLGYRTGSFDNLSSGSSIYASPNPNGDSLLLFPVSDSKIDIKGLNFILGLRYRL